MKIGKNELIYPKADNDEASKEMISSPDQLAILDARLELAVTTCCEKINEGNNGVIFKLNFTDDLEDGVGGLLDYIEDRRTGEQEKENVMKVLKLYKPGEGKKEFEMQRRAFEIVRDQGDDTCAKIPEPILFRNLEIKSEEAQEFLKNKGIKNAEQVEIIIMDMVPGVDLADHFYREVLRDNKGAIHLSDRLDQMDFNELHREVSRVLNFEVAGAKSRDEGEREFERRMVQSGNAEKLFKTLKKKGYVMNPEIIKRIEKTINLFHENGLAFRDGHHRNFMFNGEGEDLEVYVIDFGSSTTFEGELDRDVYIEGQKEYPHDKAIIKSLESLTKTQDELTADELKVVESELNSLRRMFGRREKLWQQTINDLSVEELNIEKLSNLLSLNPLLKGQSMELKNKAMAALIIDFIHQEKFSRKIIKKELTKYIEQKSLSNAIPVNQLNLLIKLLEIL